MKIHEYQAKAILAAAGVPVPKGSVATTPSEARAAAADLGGRAVVKVQVHAGGRGKAGGVKLVNSPDEAEQAAGSLLGKRLVTHQTGPEGVPVTKLLVEEVSAIEKELYLSILVDGAVKAPVMIASEAGGMEIEEVAARTPEKVLRVAIDPVTGLMPFQTRRLTSGMNLAPPLAKQATALMNSLYKVFIDNDCSLAEINPLVVTKDGRVLALDAKLNFDDDAMFRHANLEQLRDLDQEDPMDVEASKYDVNYIRLDGDVGCLVNGAGLAMATMDVIKLMGSAPANFLDVGGAATEERIGSAFKLLLSDPKVKRVLVNVFGGILRCDIVARGVVAAAKEKGVNVPLVVRMQGTNAEDGKRILQESGLPVQLAPDFQSAARLVEAAKK